MPFVLLIHLVWLFLWPLLAGASFTGVILPTLLTVPVFLYLHLSTYFYGGPPNERVPYIAGTYLLAYLLTPFNLSGMGYLIFGFFTPTEAAAIGCFVRYFGPEAADPIAAIAAHVVRRFRFSTVSIFRRTDGLWVQHRSADPGLRLDDRTLDGVFEGALSRLEFDARARAYAGTGQVRTDDGRLVWLIPLRLGMVTVGLLAVSGTLFWLMVKAMARIQMPERLPRQ